MTGPHQRSHGAAARGRVARRMALLALAAALGACTRDGPVAPGERALPGGPSLTMNPACSGGTLHLEDSIQAPVTWTRADSPHYVSWGLFVHGAGRLTLEPGVTVCFSGFGFVSVANGGTLVANGLDTARITLTAAYPVSPWSGLQFNGSTAVTHSLRNVLVEHVSPSYYSIVAYDQNAVVIDSAVIRRGGAGLYLAGRGSRISRSRVDTTLNANVPAVTLGVLGRFEQTTIRGAAGDGLQVTGTNGVYLLGGRIEGSGGVGLKVSTTGAGIVDARPIRVTGGASYPAELVVSAFPRIYPALADQDSLLGNARDTLVVTGGILQQFAYPTATIPWRVSGNITVQHYGILRASAGASLTFENNRFITAQDGGRVVARGTAAAPVRFTALDPATGWSGIKLYDTTALSSYLTNVRMEYVRVTAAVYAFAGHPVVIDSAVFRQNGSAAILYSEGSRLSRSRVDTTLLLLPAVHMDYNTTLESTLIRGSAHYGLSVDRAPVLSCEIRESASDGIIGLVGVVHNCNLVNNGGSGIRNNPRWYTADAEDNWWGDAAGPTGPAGDGVSGPVNYTPWRTTPYVLPYVP